MDESTDVSERQPIVVRVPKLESRITGECRGKRACYGFAMARSAPRFRLVAPVVPEHALQKSIAHMLVLEIAPAGKVSRHGVVWWSVDHANYAGEVPGVRIGRGIVAGLPDLFILWLGRAFFIELKSADGIMSDPQRAVIPAILEAGGRAAVITTTDQMLACLDGWGIPRKHKLEPQL